MASPPVIAGSALKFRVPQRIFRSDTPAICSFVFIPISIGTVSAPITAAIFPTEEAPFAICFATAAVTSWPDWLTPSSTIPLSAHMIMTAFFEISISSVPKIAPICAIRVSNLPIPSSGFAIWSQFSNTF